MPRPPTPIGRNAARALLLIWPAAIALLWWATTPTPTHLASNLVATYLLIWGAVALHGARPAADLRARFALMTGAIGLTLGLIELPALAGLDYGRLFPANRVEPFLSRTDIADPDLLYRHPPRFHASGWTKGDLIVSTNTRVPSAPSYRYDITYDGNGFRNPTDPTRVDVAVVGDSFVEGAQVALDELMTLARGRLRGWTVANLGQSRYGPRQERIVLERYALPLRPRVCVWAFFEGNDLADIARYDLLKAHWPPGPEPRTVGDRSFTKNALTAAIRVAGLDGSLYRELLRHSGTFHGPDGEARRLFFKYPGLPISPADRAALGRLDEILGSARLACDRAGSRLVVVFIPTKFRVYGPLCTFEPGSPCMAWAPNELPESLAAIVARISPGTGYLDLTAPFREAAARGPLLYYPDDTHWSPAGHALAARLLAEYLDARNPGR